MIDLSNGRTQLDNEAGFVVRLLVSEIARADCWHDVKKAADALFHARLIQRQMADEAAGDAAESEAVRERSSHD